MKHGAVYPDKMEAATQNSLLRPEAEGYDVLNTLDCYIDFVPDIALHRCHLGCRVSSRRSRLSLLLWRRLGCCRCI